LPKTVHADAGPSRSLWSGTLTFGLVSIPVDLFSAVRGRKTAMKLVDPKGRPLGRQYYCPKDEQTLSSSDIVRGFETDKGKMLVITEEELESVAPEMTRDIELQRFVPRDQIPPSYYQRPYFLAPSSKSAKAYYLLAETMEGSGQAGIGSFVMRGHEYLAAILSEGGLLRMATLRYADELRSPTDVACPKPRR
jgi:DNA end-binding protein Ku